MKDSAINQYWNISRFILEYTSKPVEAPLLGEENRGRDRQTLETFTLCQDSQSGSENPNTVQLQEIVQFNNLESQPGAESGRQSSELRIPGDNQALPDDLSTPAK